MQGLISDGMFKLTRNPNFFGEIMIYTSFAIAIGTNAAYAIVGLCVVFLNILTLAKDERSYSKKKGWSEYRQ